MSDWDFVHDMHERGFSTRDIADTAAVGHAPWDEAYVSRDWVEAELENSALDDVNTLESREQFRSRDGFPFSVLEQVETFQALFDCAKRHFKKTGRYLQVRGELGHIYAEVKVGLRRHGRYQAGSDGIIAGKLLEVKTISPLKMGDQLFVERQGNFEQLLTVRINEYFQRTGILIDRSRLADGRGRFLRARMRGEAGQP